eukprot:scaffold223537_cov15-Tisochrysis_lutea.AAC.1
MHTYTTTHTHVSARVLLHVVLSQGSTSPEQDPGHYLSTISSLYTWYCSPACAAAAAAEGTAAAAAASNGTPTPEFASCAGLTASSAGHHEGSCEQGFQGMQGHGNSEVAGHSGAAVGGWPPLVVNLQGWVKGLGFELTVDILRTIGPSHLLQVSSAVTLMRSPLLWGWVSVVCCCMPWAMLFLLKACCLACMVQPEFSGAVERHEGRRRKSAPLSNSMLLTFMHGPL